MFENCGVWCLVLPDCPSIRGVERSTRYPTRQWCLVFWGGRLSDFEFKLQKILVGLRLMRFA